jgi:hypothetical protein
MESGVQGKGTGIVGSIIGQDNDKHDTHIAPFFIFALMFRVASPSAVSFVSQNSIGAGFGVLLTFSLFLLLH